MICYKSVLVFAITDQKETVLLQNCTLGEIEEGETKTCDKNSVPSLGNLIQVRTSKADITLLIEVNLDAIEKCYATYNMTFKFSNVPAGSKWSNGDTACTLSLNSPNHYSIKLDVAGTWTFESEITATAKSVSYDCPTTVTITATIND